MQNPVKEGHSQKVSHTLRHAITDGKWWSVMIGFGESFLTAFAQFLGATAFMQGALITIPQFISSLVTLFSQHITTFLKSRKRLVVTFAILQAVMWICMLVFSYLFQSVLLLILFATAYFCFGAVAGPVWSSWMGDIVPENKRGRYFGLRNKQMGVWLLVSTLIASSLFAFASSINPIIIFSILFSIAFIARLISSSYLLAMYEPHVELKSFPWLSPAKYIDKASKNILSFAGANGFLHFAVFISSPFAVVLYFQTFGLTFFQFSLLVFASTLANVLTIQIWGKKSDHYGSTTILRISSILISIIPLFWIVAFLVPSGAFYLVLASEIISGIGWAAYNLSGSNFLYDNARQDYRIVFFSYHAVIRGTAILFGTIIGLILIYGFGEILIYAVIVSAVLRMIATIPIFKLKEVQPPKESPPPLHLLAGSVVADGIAVATLYGLNRTVDVMRKPLDKANEKLKVWQKKYAEDDEDLLNH